MEEQKALKIVVVVVVTVMVAMWNYFENELKNMFLFPFIFFPFLWQISQLNLQDYKTINFNQCHT